MCFSGSAQTLNINMEEEGDKAECEWSMESGRSFSLNVIICTLVTVSPSSA